MQIKLTTDEAVESLAGVYSRMRLREEIAGVKFPANSDTLAITQALIEAGTSHADASVAAQQNWFKAGQTGCVFARLIATNFSGPAWPYLVMSDSEDGRTVDAAIDRLCESDGVEMVSLIYPECITLAEFLTQIARLVDSSKFWVEKAEESAEGTSLWVRRPVAAGVQAWVMGFGPDPVLPPTRRAPFYELALRIKPKSGGEFHRLNQDPGAAHLADFPMTMPPHHWEDRWATTYRKTRAILGHEPDHVSAARSTLTVPSDLIDLTSWLAHSNRQ